jgi:hypothetical protein
MTIDERQRHQLHEAARRALGDGAAVTLMEMLPPVGWADVATKRDLDHLREVMEARFAGLDDKFSGKIAQLQTRLILWFVGTGVAVVGATGVLRLG